MNVAHGSKAIDIYIIKIFLWLAVKNIISNDNAANFFHWLETKSNRPSFRDEKTGLPAIYGLAYGMKNGKNASVGVTFGKNDLAKEISMGEATGHPLALGLKLFLQGKIYKPGVFAPEGGAINTEDFFSAYEELEDLNEGLDISRSWEK